MNKNKLGPRALTAAALLAVCTFSVARADDAQPTLYHVQESTFGCVDPGATRLLTDPTEPRRNNSSWMRTTIANGRCVTITPRSPWKLVSQDNGVALMEYAGTVGAPGSYYITISELVDPVGKHPGESAGAPAAGTPAAAANPAPNTAAAPATVPATALQPAAGNTASETALAPAPQDTNSSTLPALHGNWSTWDVLLLLIAISIAGVVGYAVGRNTREKPTV